VTDTRSWFVYILRCFDGSLYCGITPNVARRVALHNAGKACKYTAPPRRRPVKAVYVEDHYSVSSALRREAAIKKLKRRDKLALVEEGV
jgi:predicted GIY-YIG superfamily endonuclease